MEYHYAVSGEDFSLAGNASSEMKKTLKRLGLPPEIIKKTAVAMYEAEMNMVVHAGGGDAHISIENNCITIIMRDTVQVSPISTLPCRTAIQPRRRRFNSSDSAPAWACRT